MRCSPCIAEGAGSVNQKVMNDKRRKAISKIEARIEECKSELETLRDEEQEAFDNVPESIQEGERGQAMETSISSLEDAISSLEDATNSLCSAVEKN